MVVGPAPNDRIEDLDQVGRPGHGVALDDAAHLIQHCLLGFAGGLTISLRQVYEGPISRCRVLAI
jgi:hypothetical protein